MVIIINWTQGAIIEKDDGSEKVLMFKVPDMAREYMKISRPDDEFDLIPVNIEHLQYIDAEVV